MIPENVNSSLFGQPSAPTMTAATTFTFDAGTDVLALVTRVPKTGTLTGLDFRTGTVSTAGADFRMGLYAVDTSGLPTTTEYQTNSSGTVTVATSDDNVWKNVAINSGTGVTVTKGDVVAIVLKVESGTPNTVQINGTSIPHMQLSGFPYRCENTTGSLAKTTGTVPVPFAWNYGGTYEYAEGCTVGNTGSLTAPGNGNERALRFRLAAPMRVSGLKAVLANMAAGADYRMVLYDSTPTALATVEAAPADIDGDINLSTTIDAAYYFPFASSVELAANTTYYASMYQRTANSISLADIGVSDVKYMDALPGGKEFYLGTRSGGTGTFADTTTTRPYIFLLVDGIHDGTGGGGGQRVIGG